MTAKTARAVAALGASLALFLPAPAYASAVPIADDQPAAVEIGEVTVSGSGCADGKATVEREGNLVRISYPAFAAQSGIGAPPGSFRRNCQILLRVNAPQGMTYTLTRTRGEGDATLATGVAGTYRMNRYFQGQVPTISATHNFNGPLDEGWEADDQQTDPSTWIWAPCGEPRGLNINNDLRVMSVASQPRSAMTMTSTVISLDDFRVRYCPGKG